MFDLLTVATISVLALQIFQTHKITKWEHKRRTTKFEDLRTKKSKTNFQQLFATWDNTERTTVAPGNEVKLSAKVVCRLFGIPEDQFNNLEYLKMDVDRRLSSGRIAAWRYNSSGVQMSVIDKFTIVPDGYSTLPSLMATRGLDWDGDTCEIAYFSEFDVLTFKRPLNVWEIVGIPFKKLSSTS